MEPNDAVRGASVQGREPVWEPLVDLVGEELASTFMWMFEVALDDGRRLHAYKHIHTRRYLHLAQDGSAFTYRPEDWYDPIDPGLLLQMVLAPWWTQLGADPEDERLAKAAIARASAARQMKAA